jgi:glucose-6-phosphate 1-dehydrogenase
MATPPSAFRPIACQLGRSRLACEENGSWRRIIIEKPFGTDLASARKLNNDLLDVFDENQLYRIDHYLGKETVQNILVLRFANGLFEPIWNRDHIDHVQITVAETLAVGRRGRFYDETGALRDMVPNHLFQLLSLVTMEPPSRFEAGAVRSEKAEVLDAVQVPSEAEALRNSVRGQYTSGMPAIIRSRTTAPRRTCGRTARRRPMRPSDSRLTTGGGPECRFSCAPERRWRHA